LTSSETALQHRVVVGIDGSNSSLQALQWAARQAQLTASTLEVITTWEWPVSWGWNMPLPEGYNPAADAQAVVDTAIEAVRKAYPGLDVEGRVLEGHPAPALVDASRDADLLVVGSRGHGQFAGMLLGSVSEYCVGHAQCPVTVLREPH
jgi:nucleotide-binding universal stress UspA family protein